MLSAREFTAGALEDARPLSLILPRKKYEATFLVGQTENGPMAVLLSGQHAFHFFECAGNRNWKGLIIPNINIEVDETSLFDPDYDGGTLGAVIRSDTRLIVLGTTERSFGRSIGVTLYSDLPPTHDMRVAFSRWQVVIGEGEAKRVLTRIDIAQAATS